MISVIGHYVLLPFVWLLRGLYTLTHSYGLALILFTLVVKIVFLPFQMKSKKSMLRMNRFQPQMKEIQTKYANNPTKMNEEMQRLYTEEGINPMSGCLWSLLPFPIMLALYSIIRQPLSSFMMLGSKVVEEIRTLATTLGYVAIEGTGRAGFYEEINLAQFINDHFDSFRQFESAGLMSVDYKFLGIDLTAFPQDAIKQITTDGWAAIGLILIPILSAVMSLLQSKVSMAGASTQGNDTASRTNNLMMWMMPLMSLWIGFTLPGALGVYWIANSLFMIIQEMLLNKYYMGKIEKEEAEREEKRKVERLRRQEEARLAQQKQREEEKLSLKEKQKAAQEAKAEKAAKATRSTTEAGRIGDRPYARGRSYHPDHYGE